MKFYEFGKKENPVIFLFPGTCCHQRANFGEVISLLTSSFYAVKMGEEYEKRYRQHFKSPDIRRHNLQHEEPLVCRPDEWVREVVSCCGI